MWGKQAELGSSGKVASQHKATCIPDPRSAHCFTHRTPHTLQRAVRGFQQAILHPLGSTARSGSETAPAQNCPQGWKDERGQTVLELGKNHHILRSGSQQLRMPEAVSPERPLGGRAVTTEAPNSATSPAQPQVWDWGWERGGGGNCGITRVGRAGLRAKAPPELLPHSFPLPPTSFPPLPCIFPLSSPPRRPQSRHVPHLPSPPLPLCSPRPPSGPHFPSPPRGWGPAGGGGEPWGPRRGGQGRGAGGAHGATWGPSRRCRREVHRCHALGAALRPAGRGAAAATTAGPPARAVSVRLGAGGLGPTRRRGLCRAALPGRLRVGRRGAER